MTVDQLPDSLREPLAALLFSLADDKLMLGHRNADWTGLAPILEEDIAFSSLSQDELAHALTLYQLLADLLGTTADRLAYGRRAEEYRCGRLLERADEFNWATAICRNFFCDHFDALRLARLAQSSWTPLAQLAGRLAAEEQLHVQHVDSWLRRLGRGDPESRQRMQAALTALAPEAAMLWEPTPGSEHLEAAGVYPLLAGASFADWQQDLQGRAAEAGLQLRLEPPPPDLRGGRRGQHDVGFAALLEEMTEVYRVEPEAAW